MTDTPGQYIREDVRTLRDWLSDSWRFLAYNPSLTSSERREIRNSMKEVEAKLRVTISQLAAAENEKRQARLLASDDELQPASGVLAGVTVEDAAA